MRVIEKKVGETVSPEMLQEAKNLRNLAALIEGGTVIGVAYAWLQPQEGSQAAYSTFCGDGGALQMLGAVTILQRKLLNAIIEDE